MRVAWLKEHKVLLRFLLSYLVVLVLPIAIISSVIQGRILDELETEVRRSNQMLLRQVSQVMDLRIRELALLTGQMSLNPRVRDFLFRPGSGPEEVIRVMDLQKDMSIYQAPNRFVADLYVYSFKADAMVSRMARYNPHFFYQEMRRPAGVAYNDWLAGMRADYAYGTLNAATYLVRDTGVSAPQKLITYMQSLPTNEGYASGTLVAYLANEQIEQLFAPLVSGGRGTAFIADKEGRVLISTGQTPPAFWSADGQPGTGAFHPGWRTGHRQRRKVWYHGLVLRGARSRAHLQRQGLRDSRSYAGDPDPLPARRRGNRGGPVMAELSAGQDYAHGSGAAQGREPGRAEG